MPAGQGRTHSVQSAWDTAPGGTQHLVGHSTWCNAGDWPGVLRLLPKFRTESWFYMSGSCREAGNRSLHTCVWECMCEHRHCVHVKMGKVYKHVYMCEYACLPPFPGVQKCSCVACPGARHALTTGL